MCTGNKLLEIKEEVVFLNIFLEFIYNIENIASSLDDLLKMFDFIMNYKVLLYPYNLLYRVSKNYVSSLKIIKVVTFFY